MLGAHVVYERDDCGAVRVQYERFFAPFAHARQAHEDGPEVRLGWRRPIRVILRAERQRVQGARPTHIGQET